VGEKVKNEQQHFRQILDATHTYGIGRHSFIVAVGGGAVLEMAGFATAIAHRGIRHIRIPTTVLSQNDSCISEAVKVALIKDAEFFEWIEAQALSLAAWEMAHVYVEDKKEIPNVKELLENTAGIEMALDDVGKKQYHLQHER
jgi:3-dehydroquinate synthase